MNSANIKHIPLNRRGALELGLSPCEYCCTGYSNYNNGVVSSCHATCEYLKIYNDKEKMKEIKLSEYKYLIAGS